MLLKILIFSVFFCFVVSSTENIDTENRTETVTTESLQTPIPNEYINVIEIDDKDIPFIDEDFENATSFIDDEERVYGGTKAKSGAFPFMTSIQEKRHGKFSKFCGGTIITLSWVLTAGHCVYDLKPSDIIYCRAGVTEAYSESKGYQLRPVVKRIVHEKYKGGPTPNDLALLKVSPPFTPSAHVQIVRYAPYCQSVTNGGMAIGFGRIMQQEFTKNLDLNVILMNRRTLNECSTKKIDKNTHMCLNGKRQGVCPGDSGSPFVQQDKNHKFCVTGTASFIIGLCGTEEAVYVLVEKYAHWIQETIQNN